MASKTRCAPCRAFAPLPFLGDVRWRVDVAGGPTEIVVCNVPGSRCACCGKVSRTTDVMRRAELLAAVELADRGIRDGQAFRFMRKALRLSSSGLADVLDVTRETLSRWENNRFPVARTAWITVAALVADQLSGATITIERLSEFRAYRDPPPGPVAVSFGAAAPSEHLSAVGPAAPQANRGFGLRPTQRRSAVTPLRRKQQPGDAAAGENRGRRMRPAVGD